MRLLIIEDERALCETIVRSLRRLAYSVDYCYDGEKALELLSVERYDLVLLDLNLPGRDGMAVLRTLPEFNRAYEVDGMSVEEFDDFGATRKTLRQFYAADEDLDTLVRDILIPAP